MKKLLSILFIVSFLITSSAFADNNINNYEEALKAEQRAKEDKENLNLNIFINGQELEFDKKENLGMPFIDENNRIMVPMRKPVKMSGNQLSWDNKVKMANIKMPYMGNWDNPIVITVKIGDNFLTKSMPKNLTPIEAKKIPMDTKAIIKNGRTYIPLRAVMESLGLVVSYNHKTKTISAFNEGEKIWNSREEINKDFPDLLDLIQADTGGGSFGPEGIAYVKEKNTGVKIEKLRLDNSYQDNMKLSIGKEGAKWITLKTPTRDDIIFIKDKKVVFKTDAFLDDIYYYWQEWRKKGYNNGDISDVDYFVMYTDDTTATLIENPFKNKDNNDNEQIH